ncbi:MAG: transposase [Gammaproteobacteria bacterium]
MTSRAYTEALRHHCPVVDRFHAVKALNLAIDEVRKERWRRLDTDTLTWVETSMKHLSSLIIGWEIRIAKELYKKTEGP